MWMNNYKMKTIAYAVSLLSSVGLFSSYSLADDVTTSSVKPDTQQTLMTPKVSPVVHQRTYSFKQLGYTSSIHLQGSESEVYVGFGSRLDEIASRAQLSLDFITSPALIKTVSHLKVFFNNELMGVVPVEEGSQGQRVKATIPLDPRLFSNFNQLRFQLIGNANEMCGNPNAGSIWAEISPESKVTFNVQKTLLNNDLALLPAPFFDSRDMNPLRLPMVMGDHVDLEAIKAIGITSSYFGSLAEWRHTDFPVLKNEVPEENAIVFITNDNKPDFLRDYPDTDGPHIQVISHPNKPYVKLLIVSGRDSKDLTQAVRGMAFGQHLLTGPSAKITQMSQVAARQAYDAPNWIATDRPVALSELVKHQSNLEVSGYTPPAMRIDFRLPPDLFTWQSRGIPFDLAYRYSPPVIDNSGSRMSLSINEQFIKAFNLTKKGETKHSSRLRLPVVNDVDNDGGSMYIPAFKVGSRNEIKFEFGFSSATAGTELCQTTQPSKQYAAIDANSTIDFSGYPHYIEMPNMRSFSNAGFPFTRMADLSETVAILPKEPSVEVIQAFVNMMGRFGVDTGYPAIRVNVTDKWSEDNLKDKDILAIGITPGLKDVTKTHTPNMLLKEGLRLSQLPNKNEKQKGQNWVEPSTQASRPADLIEVAATGDFASIISYQSPFNHQRTVVSLLGATPDSLALINQALTDSGKVAAMFGSVVTIKADSVASFNVGEHYYVGELPVWQLVMYHFSRHPMLMAFASFILVVLVTIALWRILRSLARRRIEDSEED